VNIDASHIHGRLYIGSRPPVGRRLAWAGFDTVVLAAEEYQPAEWKIPGVEVIYAPMRDVPVRLTPEQLRTVGIVAERIARELALGRKVLVTCRAGLNRSSLLAAVALVVGSGMSPLQAIRLIRQKRSVLALNNPAFVHAIATQFSAARPVQ
jgi:protein-tyrosine phosphatase